MRRVLEPGMDTKDKVTLLLHQSMGWVSVEDLVKWVEYSSVSMFPTRVLLPLHKQKLIEFDAAKARAHISPKGTEEVETRILQSRA